MKIVNKISFSFFITAVIIISITVPTFYLMIKGDIKNAIYAHLLTTAQSRAQHIETFLEEDKNRAKILAESREIRSSLKEIIRNRQGSDNFIAKINISLKSFMKAEGEAYEIFIMTPDGKVIASTDERHIGYDRSKDDCFLGAFKGAYIKDIYYSLTTGKKGYAVSAPIRDDYTKEILGVLAMRFEMTGLNEITIDRTGLGKTGKIYLINKDGYMITESRFMDDTFLKLKVDTVNARNCLWPEEGREHVHDIGDVSVSPDYRGVSVLGAHDFIEEMGWGLLAEIDEKEALAPLTKMKFLLLAICFLVPIIVWVIGAYISKLITEPIRQLTYAAKEVGDGKLDTNINIESNDEIGELATSFNNMIRNLTNSMTSIQILNREIDERKKAEDALQKSEERYRNVVEDQTDIICKFLPDGTYTFVNNVYCHFFKKSKGELIGDKWFPDVHPEDLEMVQKKLSAMSKENPVVMIENRVFSGYGTTHWIQFVNRGSYDQDGNLLEIQSVGRDITELRELERELQKSQQLESIGVLAGGIAHDFNNLLSAINSNIYLSKNYVEKDSKGYEHLNSAEKAIHRATSLTEQLLTFSKGGSPVKKAASITEIIKESAEFALSGSNVICNYNIADDLWPVHVDKGQISQAIHNLILNSNQAMPEGGTILVHVENSDHGLDAESLTREGKYIKIVIQDKGDGIEKDHLEMIFDPYFTTKEVGMGLGLSITYSIINNHEGHISVSSEKGTGTSFTIYLPASETKTEEKEIAVDTAIAGHGKILLMDDEELVREALGGILEINGYEIEHAENGETALELYQKAIEASKPFDAVILDLTVRGGMGGKEAMKKLLKIDPDVKGIVSSGYSNDPVVANFKEYGFSDVLAKPCRSLDDLNKVLHKVIKG